LQAPPFCCVRLRQRDVAVEIVGPVAGAPTVALCAQRPRDSGQDFPPASHRILSEYLTIRRQDARQVAVAIVLLRALADRSVQTC
jgi:hypothetical protein